MFVLVPKLHTTVPMACLQVRLHNQWWVSSLAQDSPKVLARLVWRVPLQNKNVKTLETGVHTHTHKHAHTHTAICRTRSAICCCDITHVLLTRYYSDTWFSIGRHPVAIGCSSLRSLLGRPRRLCEHGATSWVVFELTRGITKIYRIFWRDESNPEDILISAKFGLGNLRDSTGRRVARNPTDMTCELFCSLIRPAVCVLVHGGALFKLPNLATFRALGHCNQFTFTALLHRHHSLTHEWNVDNGCSHLGLETSMRGLCPRDFHLETSKVRPFGVYSWRIRTTTILKTGSVDLLRLDGGSLTKPQSQCNRTEKAYRETNVTII